MGKSNLNGGAEASQQPGWPAGETAVQERRDMLDKLLRFFEVDAEVKKQGYELWGLLAPYADRIIDGFYANIRSAEIEPKISAATVERLKHRQKEHWAGLFGLGFGDDYARSARFVGARHRGIQLGSAWYVAGYMALKFQFMNVIVSSDLPIAEKGRLLRALEKFVAIDMALALYSYDNSAVLD